MVPGTHPVTKKPMMVKRRVGSRSTTAQNLKKVAFPSEKEPTGHLLCATQRLENISQLIIKGTDVPPLGVVFPSSWIPDSLKIGPIGNQPFKPTGGLWTSPITGKGKSTDWVDWCYRNEHFPGGTETMAMWSVFFPKDAIVLKVGDGYDATLLYNNFYDPEGIRGISMDFGELAEVGVDALWVTATAAHHAHGGVFPRQSKDGREGGHEMVFSGWDCDTVMWLNRFDDIRFQKLREFSLVKFSDSFLGPLWRLSEEDGLGEGYYEE